MTLNHKKFFVLIALTGQLIVADSALAAGLTEFISKGAQSTREWIAKKMGRTGNSAAIATEAQGSRVIEQGSGLSQSLKLRDILRHTDQLELLTNGALRDIYGRIKSGHYVKTLGRGKNIDRAIVSLDDPMKDILAIEGGLGVGKDQILIGLQERILSGEVPESLANSRIIQINSSHVFTGDLTKLENQFNILTNEYARDFKGRYIVSFSDIGFFTADESLNKKLFDHVVQSIYSKFGKDNVKIIVAGTSGDIKKLAAASPSASRMGRVKLEALSPSQVVELGMNIADRLKKESEFNIPKAVIDLAALLSERHLSHIGNPKSMVSLLLGAQSYRKMMMAATESPLSQHLRANIENLELELKRAESLTGAFAQQRVREIPLELKGLKTEVAEVDKRFNELKAAQKRAQEILDIIAGKIKGGDGTKRTPAELKAELEKLNLVINQITPDELALWINMETGVPIDEILKKEWSVADVVTQLKKKFFSQEDAAAAAIRAAERAKAIYRTSEQPTMSLLFVGPPGTGKTELSKLLTSFLGPMFRAQGSDYTSSHMASKLIGAPPGYVGHDKFEPGALVSFIKEFKRGGLLLDEIDQFHPDVLKLLYPMLDEGLITGSDAVPVSLRDFVVFMTTNLGQDEITRDMSQIQMKEILMRLSNGALTKAILDRIDMIILFSKLDAETYAKIIGKQLDILNAAMAKEVRSVQITKEARDQLIKPFTSGEVSARGIQQYFKTKIVDVVNRIRNSGVYLNSAGVEEKLVFQDGDILEIAYSEARGLYFNVIH